MEVESIINTIPFVYALLLIVLWLSYFTLHQSLEHGQQCLFPLETIEISWLRIVILDVYEIHMYPIFNLPALQKLIGM